MLLILLISFHYIPFAQSIDGVHRKRGLYKSFDEYFNNNPSVKDSFLITYYSRDKNDTTIIGAKYTQTDGTPFIDLMWGFCDGTSVFVRSPQSLFNVGRCWKLDYIGQFSYFTQIERSGVSVGPEILTKVISAAATRALAPKDFVTLVIDNKGKIRYLSENLLRKYLKAYPDLLTSFKNDMEKIFPKEVYDYEHFYTDEEIEKQDRLFKEYLIKLDKAKTSSLKAGL